MNDFDDDASFDDALRQRLQDGGEPDDAGFSLRVMAALPPPVAAQQCRRARWVRRVQWAAIGTAACGATALLAGAGGPLDMPHALAVAALMGLLAFWSIPSRWSRG
ncbi:hypothetical protein [Roseateles sp.]|uniref:hypothetical protein n=1 Tax=Roseateles sp. TaxID=1971397 RepID=UPI0025D8247B|nr:hypothetical protein [Roseateles sp.]MBV8036924.1 hypothetical protein [Roseateles sp.]